MPFAILSGVLISLLGGVMSQPCGGVATIERIDVQSGTVYGTAPPGYRVDVSNWFAQGATATTIADGDGNWTASVPGPDAQTTLLTVSAHPIPVPLHIAAFSLLAVAESMGVWLALRGVSKAAFRKRTLIAAALLGVPGLVLALRPEETRGLLIAHAYWLLLLAGALLVARLNSWLEDPQGTTSSEDGAGVLSNRPERSRARQAIWDMGLPLFWVLWTPLWLETGPGGPCSWYEGANLYYNVFESLRWAGIAALEVWAVAFLVWPSPQKPIGLRFLVFLPFGLLGGNWTLTGLLALDVPGILFLHGTWFVLVCLFGGLTLLLRLAKRLLAHATEASVPPSDLPSPVGVQLLLLAATATLLYLTASVDTAAYFNPGLPSPLCSPVCLLLVLFPAGFLVERLGARRHGTGQKPPEPPSSLTTQLGPGTEDR